MVTPTPTTVQVKIQLRSDTSANWASVNPVLLAGEMGLETNTNRIKIGNGSTAWNSLGYFPFAVSGGTVTGNLEIGTTGTLTFEGSSADNFETTLGVINPTADRTINLPNVSGTIITTGDTGTVTSTMIADGTIVNADVNASAAIAHSKLATITAGYVLIGNASNVPTATQVTGDVTISSTGVTAISSGVIVNADIAANAEIAVSKLANGTANQVIVTDGTNVSWSDDLTLAGNLTVNGTTTNINTQNLVVEDKNIILGDVPTPSDTTADGGGITLKGATDKTINWVDATDAWTSSERFSVPLGSAASPSLTFTGDENSGVFSPGADQVAISTNGTGRLFVDANGSIIVNTSTSRANITGSSRPSFQIEGTNYAGALASICRVSDSPAAAATLAIAKTRGSSVGSNSAVQSGDTLGRLSFEGSDGTAFYGSASITAVAAETFTSTSAAGHLLFNTTPTGAGSSTERLRITSAGLVGVGTSSPGSILHCNYATATDTYIRTTNSAGTNGFDFGVSSGGEAWVFNRNNSNMYLGTNSAQRVTITAGGNVGIGTTSPTSILHVNQDVSSGNYQSRITLENTDQRTIIGSYWQSGVGAYSLIQATNQAESTGEALLLNPSGGNVGIGTTAPTSLLEASGANCIIKSNGSTGYGAFYANGASGNSSYLFLATAGTETARLRADAPGELVFGTGSSGTERARIDSSGRLLVGTSSSVASLSGLGAQFQVNEGGGVAASLLRSTNDVSGANLVFRKTRDTTPTGATVVQSGDSLGNIYWMGTDGTNAIAAAQITVAVDGTPGANDMPGRLVFSTTADGASSPTERMRISNNGYVGINGTASRRLEVFDTRASEFAAAINNESTTGHALALVCKSSDTVGIYLNGYSSSANTTRINIYSNGNILNSNNSYGALSDARLKDNITDASSQWDDIKAVQVRNYNLKTDPDHRQIGVVAQEIEQVSPGLVYESPDRDAQGNDLGTVTKSVNYSVLYMKAVKALQEAMERIETLEAKVAALESA